MPQRAHISSVDALQAFRTNLLVYLSKARPALEEAGGEVLRVRLWLENERRPFWARQLMLRNRKLEDAESALFISKLSKIGKPSAAEQASVQKARAAVAEAEEKMRGIKRWDRDYEKTTGPLLKQLEKLDTLLSMDVPKAVAYLNEAIDTLQKYASLAAPTGSAAGAPPSGLETPAPEIPAGEKEKT
jgi:hypothetical protein